MYTHWGICSRRWNPARRHAAARRLARLADAERAALLLAAVRDADCEAGLALRNHAFAARAEASPLWALTELSERLDAGELASARAAAESVAPFWDAPEPGLLASALNVAARLADPDIALMLLRPFPVEWFMPVHADGLTAGGPMGCRRPALDRPARGGRE
ncbi:MAG: hypothetical protein ACYCVZ_18185 [Streptosporangiaceae bacterium]